MSDADAGQKMTNAFNDAVNAVFRECDRGKAERRYLAALQASKDLGDDRPYVLGWRAMILYQRGVNLLKLFGLENCAPIPEAKLADATKIRTIWFEFMEIAKRLDDPGFQDMFRRKHQFDIGQAVNSVRHDPIYRGSPIELTDGTLVPWYDVG